MGSASLRMVTVLSAPALVSAAAVFVSGDQNWTFDEITPKMIKDGQPFTQFEHAKCAHDVYGADGPSKGKYKEHASTTKDKCKELCSEDESCYAYQWGDKHNDCKLFESLISYLYYDSDTKDYSIYCVLNNDREEHPGRQLQVTSHPGCPTPKKSVQQELKPLTEKVGKGVDLLHVKTIDLRDMDLDDCYAASLATLICHGEVEDLNLSYNEINNDAAEAIGKAVAYSSQNTLKRLELGHNQINTYAFKHFLKPIQDTPKQLVLQDLKFTEQKPSWMTTGECTELVKEMGDVSKFQEGGNSKVVQDIVC